MKNLKLKHCSFFFTTANLDEYEVRFEKRDDGIKDADIFLDGNYKVTYPTKLNANQSNAIMIIDMYAKGLPDAVRLATFG